MTYEVVTKSPSGEIQSTHQVGEFTCTYKPSLGAVCETKLAEWFRRAREYHYPNYDAIIPILYCLIRDYLQEEAIAITKSDAKAVRRACIEEIIAILEQTK